MCAIVYAACALRMQLANELSQIKQVILYNSPTISSNYSNENKHIFYHEQDPIQGLYENDVGKMIVTLTVTLVTIITTVV